MTPVHPCRRNTLHISIITKHHRSPETSVIMLTILAVLTSRTGSSDATPTVRTTACQYNSCSPGAAYGNNASDPRLNWVNSYPVTSIKYGINTLSPQYLGGAPEFAVAGPNVGSNLAVQAFFSGTIGAAVYAATNGIPSIAFSGASGSATAWNATTPLYSQVYADLALNLTQAVLASGKPYLPDDVFLNVNFPDVSSTECSSASQFKFVLSRINLGIPLITSDVETCGSTILPWEVSVIGTDGCYVSVSVGDATDKTTASKDKQAVVLQKLQKILSCL